jgi:hypothetical protein
MTTTTDKERMAALPEPFDYFYEFGEPHPARTFSPAPRNGVGPHCTVAIYTGYQMQAFRAEGIAALEKENAELRKQLADRATASNAVPVFWYDPETSVERRRLIDDAEQLVITGANVRFGNYTTPMYGTRTAAALSAKGEGE